MEIRSEPSNLQINDNKTTVCPCCNIILQKEIKKGNYLIDDIECGYCRYSLRPFTGANSYWHERYPNGCYCNYGAIY